MVGDNSSPYENDAWRYIDSLPDAAQEILLKFVEQTKSSPSPNLKPQKTKNNNGGGAAAPAQLMKESKTINNMKQTMKIAESKLRTIVAESIKKVLKESNNTSLF